MDLKTFFGANSSDVISQMAISKSICGNLNSLVGSSGNWSAAVHHCCPPQLPPAQDVLLRTS